MAKASTQLDRASKWARQSPRVGIPPPFRPIERRRAIVWRRSERYSARGWVSWVVYVLLLPWALGSVAAQEDAQRFEKVAQRLVRAVNAQDGPAIEQDFSEEMLNALPSEKSKELFARVLFDFGKIEKLDRPRFPAPNRAVFFARCARRDLEITVALNEHGKILGLSFLPPAIPVPNRLVTSFHLPFEGEWLVLWGGDSGELNRHHDSPHQRFAFDFVVVDQAGRTHRGEGKENKDYYAFGQPVLAPADGVVTDVVTGIRDNTPGSMNPAFAGGNAVVVMHRDLEVSVLAHFQQGSIRVNAGDKVRRGQVLGLCGNSGNSSEPHIHFHVQNTPIIQNATGLRCAFEEITVTKDGKCTSRSIYLPVRGDRVRQNRNPADKTSRRSDGDRPADRNAWPSAGRAFAWGDSAGSQSGDDTDQREIDRERLRERRPLPAAARQASREGVSRQTRRGVQLP